MTSAEQIVDIVEQHWKTRCRALLLSQLGLQIKNRGIDLSAELGGGKLLDWIKRDLHDSLRLIQHPQHLLVTGLVPASAQLPEPIDALFSSDSKGSPRLSPPVWAAFTKPLNTGARRIVTLSPSFRFHDITNQDVGASAIEVSRSQVDACTAELEADADGASLKIVPRVMEWARAAGVPHSAIVFAPKKGERRDLTLLEAIFVALSPAQLTRLAMPLDIAKKLHETNRG